MQWHFRSVQAFQLGCQTCAFLKETSLNFLRVFLWLLPLGCYYLRSPGSSWDFGHAAVFSACFMAMGWKPLLATHSIIFFHVTKYRHTLMFCQDVAVLSEQQVLFVASRRGKQKYLGGFLLLFMKRMGQHQWEYTAKMQQYDLSVLKYGYSWVLMESMCCEHGL